MRAQLEAMHRELVFENSSTQAQAAVTIDQAFKQFEPVKVKLTTYLRKYAELYSVENYRRNSLGSNLSNFFKKDPQRFHSNKRVVNGEVPALLAAIDAIPTELRESERLKCLQQIMAGYLFYAIRLGKGSMDIGSTIFPYIEKLMHLSVGLVDCRTATKLMSLPSYVRAKDKDDSASAASRLHRLITRHRDRYIHRLLSRCLPGTGRSKPVAEARRHLAATLCAKDFNLVDFLTEMATKQHAMCPTGVSIPLQAIGVNAR